jgi:N-acetylmuramoyl-L-alanine amidase
MRIMLRLLLVLAAAVFAGGAAANKIADMRLIGDADKTRFVVDLEATPQYAISRLSDPERLIIDLPEAEFADPAKRGEGRGLVSDYRYGLIAPGKARIVLDLAAPVEIVNTFVLDPRSPEPARLVVDLAPTSAEKFEAGVSQDAPQLRIARRAAAPRVPLTGKPVVVVDPGHGGIDSGAVGEGGLLEKDVTLRFAQELARHLEAGGALHAVLTRDEDTFLALSERVEVARDHAAKLFISVHADTVRQDYVRGATVYTLSEEASDALAAAVAAQENRSDILAGFALEDQPDEVADILVDLAQRETRNLSVRFAKSLVGDMDGGFLLNSNPWRRASFKVLKAPDVPSVLLELGYLSNPKDEEMFRAEGWPKKEAETVARAVEAFIVGNGMAQPVR